jgi:bifunctional non-homologous end joining protein LigD
MSVTFSNLDRVLWPETGFTKGDMIEYYRAVAPALVPHLARRPLTLWRFPEGVHRQGFWQNECRGAPEWLATATIRGQRFCVVDDVDSLLWIANLGTVELHPFLFRVEEPERPTALVLDLDPGPPAGLLDACEIALRLRGSLPGPSFPKTSGGFGLHVFVPLAELRTFAETKAVARGLAESLAAELPERVIASARRDERRGRVLVDWLQNDATRSTVAPYSLRGRPRPSVSTPVTWDEVERAVTERRAELLQFGPAEVLERIERLGDLFAA